MPVYRLFQYAIILIVLFLGQFTLVMLVYASPNTVRNTARELVMFASTGCYSIL